MRFVLVSMLIVLVVLVGCRPIAAPVATEAPAHRKL